LVADRWQNKIAEMLWLTHFGDFRSRKKSPPDVPGGRCRHAVLAAALAGAERTGS